MRLSGLLLIILAFAEACSGTDTLTAGPEAPVRARDVGASPLVVMTRNMYIGADVDRVIGALISPDPTDDQPSLLAAIETLTLTDFPTRARAMADEIAAARPDAVGLQEVSTIGIDLSGLGVPINIQQDFLATLQAALAARGLNYVVAAEVTNIQANPVPGVSLVDRDVLLVERNRVQLVGSPVQRNYSQNIGPVAPGVSLVRGYLLVDARVRGRPVSIVSTHLESGSSGQLPLLRAAQAAELVQAIGTGQPAVILGDLNDGPGSPMYQVLQGAGFVDLWSARGHGHAVGNTCCHAADLSNSVAHLTQRLDYIWARGLGAPGLTGDIRLIGEQARDRVAGPAFPIWPSDHAGLVARVILGPAVPPTT